VAAERAVAAVVAGAKVAAAEVLRVALTAEGRAVVASEAAAAAAASLATAAPLVAAAAVVRARQHPSKRMREEYGTHYLPMCHVGWDAADPHSP
jgi:hypothetical protein|tara:strand:- start:1915 stop:2196 length:282 start_codon:yes stop_codon:yes gene_type:complete